MTILTTLHASDITYNDLLLTRNTGDITYNDITYGISKCNITCMFLSTVKSKVIHK
jgi:hypothetical protein